MKLFVYGTLKSKYGNNRLLSRAVGPEIARVSGYKLVYSHGPGSFPYAVPDLRSRVRGEVWELPDDSPDIRSIDSLEGHPNWYIRTEVRTTDGELVHMYVMPDEDKFNNTECTNDGVEFVWER